MVITAKCKKTIFEKGNFKIIKYQTLSPVTLSDGTETNIISAKGKNLPDIPGMTSELEGDFVSKKDKDGTIWYTLDVKHAKELLPTEKENIIKYLSTFPGVGNTIAKRIYKAFGNSSFDVIENDLKKLSTVQGISKKKANRIVTEFLKKKNARELFQYLYKFNIPDNKVMKIFDKYKAQALDFVKKDPYLILNVAGIGFSTAEVIAKANKLPRDMPSRMKAGILEVLAQSERGGNLFMKNSKFPSFMYDRFLQQRLCDQMMNINQITTGNTYLPRDIVYLQLLKLVDYPLTESNFDILAKNLQIEKKIFIAHINNKEYFYLQKTAISEYGIAKKIGIMLSNALPYPSDMDQRISFSEKKLKVMLSKEQHNAVKMALTNHISIITGGPGTGKTSVQKILLDVFHSFYPNRDIVLAAPTGRAASKMSESTGHPASTLYKALQLYATENGFSVYSDEPLDVDLMVIDEASMIDSLLMGELMKRLPAKAQLVIVGDADQLASIGAGSVLKELISSNAVPITKLTTVFRQAEGSTIAINAARIKANQNNLMYEKDFIFNEQNDSEDIIKELEKIYPKAVAKYGLDEVAVLTSFKRKTITGVNELNPRLRTLINKNCTNSDSAKINGDMFYVGDKVMYKKNTEELTNGDIGYITALKQSKGELSVTINFESGKNITLEDDDAKLLELAYSVTIHKSQGSEYSMVIMLVDKAHRSMFKKELLYTGVTRSKKMAYIIGDLNEFKKGILKEESQKRLSMLSQLTTYYVNTVMAKKKKLYPKRKEENEKQLKII